MSAGSIHRRISVVALFVALGCARGGEGPGDGSVRPNLDGALRVDSGRNDGGRGDGGGDLCTPRGFATTCPDATDVGPIGVGERFESEPNIVMRASSQWVRVTFPPAPPMTPEGAPPSMAGGGAPTIRLSRNDEGLYRIELRPECVGVATCAEGGSAAMPGMATDITEWSFQDDTASSATGLGQFSTRTTPWPTTLNVRIYPRSDPGCAQYQLEIVR